MSTNNEEIFLVSAQLFVYNTNFLYSQIFENWFKWDILYTKYPYLNKINPSIGLIEKGDLKVNKLSRIYKTQTNKI